MDTPPTNINPSSPLDKTPSEEPKKSLGELRKQLETGEVPVPEALKEEKIPLVVKESNKLAENLIKRSVINKEVKGNLQPPIIKPDLPQVPKSNNL